jgi:hypothetical protein
MTIKEWEDKLLPAIQSNIDLICENCGCKIAKEHAYLLSKCTHNGNDHIINEHIDCMPKLNHYSYDI